MSAHLRTTKTKVKGGRQVALLRELARLYGVATTYQDIQGRRKQATPEGLLAVTRSLGAPIHGMKDVPRALAERRDALWQRMLEPVAVAWEGRAANFELRLPTQGVGSAAACHVELETGETRTWTCNLNACPVLHSEAVGRGRYVVRKLELPGPLPWGYHRLRIELRGRSAEALLIAAPLQAFRATSLDGKERKAWGLFLPLYALYSGQSWGSGDFTDLEKLMRWTKELGGAAVACLPLLAGFLESPFDPSPYAPASRLFWNEFYLDVTRIEEFKQCEPARSLLSLSEVQSELASLREVPLVDYRRGMALKRRVLQEMARYFFRSVAPGFGRSSQPEAESGGRGEANRLEDFHRFLSEHPLAEDYARFRATCERQRAPWPLWPQPQRDGNLAAGDYSEEAWGYHLYVQWLAEEQLKFISREGRKQLSGLYLDLPLGFHAAGYDVWRWRDTFVPGISAGAPPDTFFTKGQVWSFPPLHPGRLREQGYSYFIGCLRHQLRHATMLRIDHVMGFHRLFWVPEGLRPSEGAYVQYQAEEFYAICTLESHRHQSTIVGENLGTVPPSVNPALARHNIKGTYVLQYELVPGRTLRPIPPDSVASLNTHDTPVFAGFWQALDIQDQCQLGLLSAPAAKAAEQRRAMQKRTLINILRSRAWLNRSSAAVRPVVRASLELLSASRACFVLVSLEDLWLETQPQNVPGTGPERPNWRRKARCSLEAFCQSPAVAATLRKVNRIRAHARA